MPLPDFEITMILLVAVVVVDEVVVAGNLSRSDDEFAVDIRAMMPIYNYWKMLITSFVTPLCISILMAAFNLMLNQKFPMK